MNKISPVLFPPQNRQKTAQVPGDTAEQQGESLKEREIFLAELKRQVENGSYKPDSREVAKTIVHILVPPD